MIYNKTALVCDRCMTIVRTRLTLEDINYYEDLQIECDKCYESDKKEIK